MFAFDFMRHAAMGCILVSLLAGVVGWFLLLRGQAFAAHSLTHVGFSGAAGAVWLGLPPLAGMGVFSLVAGLVLGIENLRERRPLNRDGITGLVLSASLGLGMLFLHLSNGASSLVTTLLFGDVLGLSMGALKTLTILTCFCLCLLLLIGRPLLFASLNPEMALARGVPVRMLSLSLMGIAAMACAVCSEIAGALLSFSLMVGPAATALRLNLSPLWGLLASVVLAVFLSLGGLVLSWQTDIPVPFWIGAGALGIYIFAGWVMAWRTRYLRL
ncbi:metal ABC transporter permease [Neokomagataea tanensis]|uniref:Metal ABC transporter permease n=1 Tax=Neokomagataea tanensis TaxID=661191 RepID=A0A4Y6V9R8_9PROT|nr:MULTISPECIES: metal ABC transporter permease [Neokomagataea]QDH25226.1 metal ABC transporter permease [Neokomagataea tanensis]